MKYTDDQIADALACVNKHGKIAVNIEKRQLYLNSMCRETPEKCTFDEIGFRCPNLICVNSYIQKQFSEEFIKENLKTEDE